MIRKEKNKIKIIFICEYFPSGKIIDVHGGVEIRTFYIAKELAKNHHVTVITSKETDKPNNQILHNIRITRVGLKRGYQHKGDFVKRLIFIISSVLLIIKKEADIIEGSGLLGQITVLLTKKIKKTVSIAFVPDTFSNFSKYFGKLHNFLLTNIEKIIFKSSFDGYIVISNIVKQKLLRLGIKESRIAVIPCPIDLKEIRRIKGYKISNSPSICVISRLVSYKRVIDILKALKIINENNIYVECNIIGEGNEKKSLQNFVINNHLGKNVHFNGYIKDHKEIIKILKSSWIYCSASIAEGFGISVVEAMASNIPFIVTDIPVYKEITFLSGGLFFNSLNYKDLARKTVKLLNKKIRDKIIYNNQKLVENYDVGIIAKDTEKYFLSLILH